MRSVVPRALSLLLAASALSCENNPVIPPDSEECETVQVTFTLNSNPATFDEVGTLSTASCLLGRGSYADRYEFVVTTASLVTINLISDEFDTLLILRNENDVQIFSDDDGGDEQNSRLSFTIPPGTYYIMATTYEDGDVGEYSLSIDGVSPP